MVNLEFTFWVFVILILIGLGSNERYWVTDGLEFLGSTSWIRLRCGGPAV